MRSLRTTLCVRFKSETVACGIIFMAARRCKVQPAPYLTPHVPASHLQIET